jgi:shikimate dehydrogenase
VVSDNGRYVAGLIGSGVGTSLSPPLHEHEAELLGLRYLYQLIDIDELGMAAEDAGSLILDAERMGFAGLNITHPCKQTVLPILDELSPDAAAVGAVNTVVFTGGRKVGHNTDWSGFATGFTRGLPGAALGEVVLLGAGGAGAAVAHAMLALGVRRLTLFDLDRGRADRLAAALLAARHGPGGDRAGGNHPGGGHPAVGTDTIDNLPDRLRTADGLINATPVGMTPHHGMPLPAALLRPQLWVADIVYRPLETELLRHARERGCAVLPGGGMVVYQAAEALRLFTGHTPDPERMYRHFESLSATPSVS